MPGHSQGRLGAALSSLAVATLTMAACASRIDSMGADRGRAPLAGTSWEVRELRDDAGAPGLVLSGTQLTVVFGDDGRVTGSAGCNSYFAAYAVKGGTITIGLPGTTRRFCGEVEGLMEQEARFLGALPTTATFRIDGDTLTLRAADGDVAASLVRFAAGP